MRAQESAVKQNLTVVNIPMLQFFSGNRRKLFSERTTMYFRAENVGTIVKESTG